jgi:hypothetical protein
MSKANSRKKTKPTEDTLVYLNDIRGTAELFTTEVERIEEMIEPILMTAKPEAFESAIDDLASQIFKQYLQIQKIKSRSFKWE